MPQSPDFVVGLGPARTAPDTCFAKPAEGAAAQSVGSIIRGPAPLSRQESALDASGVERARPEARSARGLTDGKAPMRLAEP